MALQLLWVPPPWAVGQVAMHSWALWEGFCPCYDTASTKSPGASCRLPEPGVCSQGISTYHYLMFSKTGDSATTLNICLFFFFFPGLEKAWDDYSPVHLLPIHKVHGWFPCVFSTLNSLLSKLQCHCAIRSVIIQTLSDCYLYVLLYNVHVFLLV